MDGVSRRAVALANAYLDWIDAQNAYQNSWRNTYQTPVAHLAEEDARRTLREEMFRKEKKLHEREDAYREATELDRGIGSDA